MVKYGNGLIENNKLTGAFYTPLGARPSEVEAYFANGDFCEIWQQTAGAKNQTGTIPARCL